MNVRGIILAGGFGTRLWPATAVTSKQIIPVYNKPMVYYPISTLMLAGIRDIVLISTPRDLPIFQTLIGDGSQWGVNFEYAEQFHPSGLAQALQISEVFLNFEPSVLILGDNLIYGSGLGRNLSNLITETGAAITAYQVSDPSGLGVVIFDNNGNPIDLVEKPQNLISRWAIPGIYFYDGSAPERVKSLRPSSRGELEITDLNKTYLDDGLLSVLKLERGTAWLDLGTPEGLLDASQFVKTIEDRQGLLIGSPEEVAVTKGYISLETMLENIEGKSSDYANRLRSFFK